MSLLAVASTQLGAQGIENPHREALVLLAHCLGTSYEAVFMDPPQALIPETQRKFESLLARRLGGEPLSKIKGVREFWSETFIVTADTLDPRPDSEAIIEAVLQYFPEREAPYRILDLGTGSGCLLLSLLKEYPKATGIGVDICEKALDVAFRNAANLQHQARCQFICSNWTTALGGTFDIIVSNPPYIAIDEALSPTVSQYDPPQALFAGTDGLLCFGQLLPDLKTLCHIETYLFFEIGFAQQEAVKELITKNAGVNLAFKPDLQGHSRVAVFSYSNPF